MDMWITLVYTAIIGGIIWAALTLTHRSVQALRRRAVVVAHSLEGAADISVKGADK